MSVVAGAAYPPRLYKRGPMAVLIILALLGMSIAAVRNMQCRAEDQCIADSGGCLGDARGALGDGPKTTRCELTGWGRLRIELSETAVDVLRRLGVPISYYRAGTFTREIR